MNPWLIVSWIGAICVAVLMIALTGAVVVALLKADGKSKPKRVI